jgi:hypothetical protein
VPAGGARDYDGDGGDEKEYGDQDNPIVPDRRNGKKRRRYSVNVWGNPHGKGEGLEHDPKSMPSRRRGWISVLGKDHARND